MTKNIKLYKFIFISAIASIIVKKIIRRVFDIELFSDELDIIPLIITLIFYTIWWYKRPKSDSDII